MERIDGRYVSKTHKSELVLTPLVNMTHRRTEISVKSGSELSLELPISVRSSQHTADDSKPGQRILNCCQRSKNNKTELRPTKQKEDRAQHGAKNNKTKFARCLASENVVTEHNIIQTKGGNDLKKASGLTTKQPANTLLLRTENIHNMNAAQSSEDKTSEGTQNTEINNNDTLTLPRYIGADKVQADGEGRCIDNRHLQWLARANDIDDLDDQPRNAYPSPFVRRDSTDLLITEARQAYELQASRYFKTIDQSQLSDDSECSDTYADDSRSSCSTFDLSEQTEDSEPRLVIPKLYDKLDRIEIAEMARRTTPEGVAECHRTSDIDDKSYAHVYTLIKGDSDSYTLSVT